VRYDAPSPAPGASSRRNDSAASFHCRQPPRARERAGGISHVFQGGRGVAAGPLSSMQVRFLPTPPRSRGKTSPAYSPWRTTPRRWRSWPRGRAAAPRAPAPRPAWQAPRCAPRPASTLRLQKPVDHRSANRPLPQPALEPQVDNHKLTSFAHRLLGTGAGRAPRSHPKSAERSLRCATSDASSARADAACSAASIPRFGASCVWKYLRNDASF